MLVTIDDFQRIDIRSGTITQIAPFPEARKPAWKLWIDFGPELGVKRSSAQIVHLYGQDALVGRQILAVVNFPPRQIGSFMSEVLVLGLETEEGVVLIGPERKVEDGRRVS